MPSVYGLGANGKKRVFRENLHARGPGGTFTHSNFGRYQDPNKKQVSHTSFQNKKGETIQAFGQSKEVAINAKLSKDAIKATLNPGDRLMKSEDGTHLIVKPDGSGIFITSNGSRIAVSKQAVQTHIGSVRSRVVDHSPAIAVKAKTPEEAKSTISKHMQDLQQPSKKLNTGVDKGKPNEVVDKQKNYYISDGKLSPSDVSDLTSKVSGGNLGDVHIGKFYVASKEEMRKVIALLESLGIKKINGQTVASYVEIDAKKVGLL